MRTSKPRRGEINTAFDVGFKYHIMNINNIYISPNQWLAAVIETMCTLGRLS
jgi:hypothetical protein